jgi:hypothetical protein
MDWNRDGKVDGHDMVHFHEVINSDSVIMIPTILTVAAEMDTIMQVLQMMRRLRQ